MPYRPGDPTETFEVRILKKTAKSYLVETTTTVSVMDEGVRYFVPISQIVGDPIEPDPEARVMIEVTEWWWKKREDFKAT